MPIFVDDREPEEVIKGLRRQNLAIEIHHNDSGDYVFGEEQWSRTRLFELALESLLTRLYILLYCERKWTLEEKQEGLKLKEDLELAIRTITISIRGENTHGKVERDSVNEWGMMNINNIEEKLIKEHALNGSKNSFKIESLDVKSVASLTLEPCRFTTLKRYNQLPTRLEKEFGSIFTGEKDGKILSYFAPIATQLSILIKEESRCYSVPNVAIERKTVSDLISSVCSKNHRLWDQLGTMKDTYQQPILLVEGMINWKDPYLSGILTTVLLFWKYQTIFTLGMEETALAVGHLFTKQGIGKSGRIPPAAVKKQFSPTEVMREMLQCIEGIGPKTAHRILEEIPLENFTVLDIFNLDEELRRVKGLPSKSRKMLTQVFRGGEVEES